MFLQKPVIKVLTHYNCNCKNPLIVHTCYNFISQLQRFFQQFYKMDNFHVFFFEKKIFTVSVVVCVRVLTALNTELPGYYDITMHW